ncbi:PREDICTED: urocanate hydratase-like, partial [Propithecus coquereli]|uniref:urocanate hydratase-like n=1 Tax=Propithecus coquereli TaxID=379532 RepID=UPI00063FAC6D
MSSLQELCSGLPLRPLPENRGRWAGVPHAPVRTPGLSPAEQQLALRNALRYFPPDVQELLAPEFAQELRLYGHIYMYRFCPDVEMKAYPIDRYPCRTKAAAAIMHMLMNNLDPAVAQVTAGETEARHRPTETSHETRGLKLTGVSHRARPIIPFLGEQNLFAKSLGGGKGPELGGYRLITSALFFKPPRGGGWEEGGAALGLVPFSVVRYGQMTAGSYCYIGPQGIVHGTVLTVLNAARRYLGVEDLAGKVFVTSGLGGMSGAQAKAAVIVGCIGVIAEVDRAALEKRRRQGWLMEVTDSLDRCIERLREARTRKEVLSLGYHGNVVALWERLVHVLDTTGEGEAINGGFGLVLDGTPEAEQKARMMLGWDVCNGVARRCWAGNPKAYEIIRQTMRENSGLVVTLPHEPAGSGGPGRVDRLAGWTRTLASACRLSCYQHRGRPPGPSWGGGLRRSPRPGALLCRLRLLSPSPPQVVGSQARILYSDQKGRVAIAVAINEAIRQGKIKVRTPALGGASPRLPPSPPWGFSLRTPHLSGLSPTRELSAPLTMPQTTTFLPKPGFPGDFAPWDRTGRAAQRCSTGVAAAGVPPGGGDCPGLCLQERTWGRKAPVGRSSATRRTSSTSWGADVGKEGAGRTEFRYPSYVQHIMGVRVPGARAGKAPASDLPSPVLGGHELAPQRDGAGEDKLPRRQVAHKGCTRLAWPVQELAQGLGDASPLHPAMITWEADPGPTSLKFFCASCIWVLHQDDYREGGWGQGACVPSSLLALLLPHSPGLSLSRPRARPPAPGAGSDGRAVASVSPDMAVQNFVGDAFRGATWVALHNGGGVGWGEAINGGFGLVLDGTPEAEQKARMMLGWDVCNGVARRCWAGNPKAYEIIRQTMRENSGLVVTL